VSIGIAWIGEGPDPERLIGGAVAALGREYSVPIVRLRFDDRPANTFDAARQQHSSRVMLAWLAERAGTGVELSAAARSTTADAQSAKPAGLGRLLGITDVDLFIPVLTFVFGEAQLGGRAAIVSLARLTEVADPVRLAARLCKEAVHEIGHTFGLVHCVSTACVMSRSPGLRAVDLKDDRLCADCRVRYRELTEQSHVPTETPHPDR
jgi:archaemetzincin